MRQPPPLTQFFQYPVVGGVALLSLAVTLAEGLELVDASPLHEGAEIREGQVWRLVTSILPHADFLHLAFNLYWLWVLGSVVENVFGHAKTLALVLFLAVGSGAPEYALVHGGVGLSGVGYGLVGMLWVLSRRDERFRDAVDVETAALFAGWFVLCVVLTATDVMAVGNVAHGAGALLGVATGRAVSARRRRGVAVAFVTVASLAVAAALVYARPYVNFTKERGWERAGLGYKALLKDDHAAAVKHLEEAVRVDPGMGHAWFNLGIAYEELDRPKDAAVAYRKAAELDPQDTDMREALEAIEDELKALEAEEMAPPGE